MSERAINDPTVAGWELNPDTGYWMWAAGSGGGSGYDDAEVRGLIAANTSAISANTSDISDNSGRIDALENAGGGSLWTDNGDGSISYSGTAKATDFIAE